MHLNKDLCTTGKTHDWCANGLTCLLASDTVYALVSSCDVSYRPNGVWSFDFLWKQTFIMFISIWMCKGKYCVTTSNISHSGTEAEPF